MLVIERRRSCERPFIEETARVDPIEAVNIATDRINCASVRKPSFGPNIGQEVRMDTAQQCGRLGVWVQPALRRPGGAW